jgi:hypothetical protein
MANNKKIIYLGLDYSNFDGGATEVNRKMQVLDSQFKLASEQVKAYGSETDQLTLKQETLTQKINLQTQKVKLSKEAYDKAVESGKASDKQLDNLLKAYNNNQTSLQKLNNELEDNKTKIEQANKSSSSFGDTIRGLASSLGINISPALEAVAKKFDGINSSVGNAVLTVGAITTALGGCTIAAANFADDVLTMSATTGIATDQLQKMQYASDFLDVEVGAMTGSITKLTRNMDDARNGSSELEKAFKTLKVNYKDANNQLKDSEQVFYDTIDALGKVKNETERDALAMTLLGKSAKELNPLIEAGSKRLKELGIEAEDMGAIMSEDSLDSLGQFKDSMDKLNNTFEATKLKLGLALLPVLQGFADLISGIPAPVLTGIVVFAALAAVIISVAKAASTMAIANAALSVSNTTLGTTGVLATVGMGPLLLILLGIAAAIALIIGKAAGIKDAMNDVKDAASDLTGSANKSLNGIASISTNPTYKKVKSQEYGNTYFIPDINSSNGSKGFVSGTDDYPGGEFWVGEGGPEKAILPRGTRILTNAESKASQGGDNYYININARDIKEFNDIVNIMNRYKQTVKQGVVPRG